VALLQTISTNTSSGGGTASTVTVDNFPSTYPVTGTVAVSNFPATQPISGAVTVSNFPSSYPVTGTFWQATQPVSAASLPLPSGASTEATLSTLNTKIPSSLTVTSTRLLVDGSGVTQPVSGTFWQATQPVSIAGTVATTTTPAAAPATYFAAISGLLSAASATDLFTLTGSASKTVKLTKITITATRTTGTQTVFKLIKRSAANSGGTATNPTAVPADSNNAAATATVAAYTANPAALGAAVGDILSQRYFIAGTGTATTPIVFTFGGDVQPVVLRGTSEVFALNLDAVTVAGGTFYVGIEWTEE